MTNTKPNYKKCSECGRFSDTFKGKCAYCSKLNYLYSQGALTLKTYNKLMGDWVK